MRDTLWTRREVLAGGAAALGVSPFWQALAAAAEQTEGRRFRIGACDWSLRKRQRPEAFAVAAEIGLDGVEVSFSEPGSEFDLRDEAVRRRYRDESRRHGLEIASLAMGVLNRIPYAVDPRTEQWVADVVPVMAAMDVRVCLLAFFGKGDIKGDRTRQDEVIQRLKRVAPTAERAGVVLGVESQLNADDHMRIVDSVASPAVKVYYDVANMHAQGYDIYQEIRQLGRERICQFHMKERRCLLGDGPIDFRRVKEAIDEIGFGGWLIIEGATVPDKTLVECYRDNQRFLRSLFLAAKRG
ncbi:MAG TPA: sugar phosphate isomerase/epimerase [Planctomycetaceae bacterium]|nr:sugar phosphate isomerase/epimerase [Planctomycetaceae bacterium]HIQ22231.1 sugar phosphate isomerase/epimerase [Planctomycetota bacterium]